MEIKLLGPKSYKCMLGKAYVPQELGYSRDAGAKKLLSFQQMDGMCLF